ncbi:MAG: hypothetical protein ACI943_003041, partial [Gammaproteobacteria bacterium]
EILDCAGCLVIEILKLSVLIDLSVIPKYLFG